jgi:hypothetical protein
MLVWPNTRFKLDYRSIASFIREYDQIHDKDSSTTTYFTFISLGFVWMHVHLFQSTCAEVDWIVHFNTHGLHAHLNKALNNINIHVLDRLRLPFKMKRRACKLHQISHASGSPVHGQMQVTRNPGATTLRSANLQMHDRQVTRNTWPSTDRNGCSGNWAKVLHGPMDEVVLAFSDMGLLAAPPEEACGPASGTKRAVHVLQDTGWSVSIQEQSVPTYLHTVEGLS